MKCFDCYYFENYEGWDLCGFCAISDRETIVADCVCDCEEKRKEHDKQYEVEEAE